MCLSLAIETVRTWAVPLRSSRPSEGMEGKTPGKKEKPLDIHLPRSLTAEEIGLGSASNLSYQVSMRTPGPRKTPPGRKLAHGSAMRGGNVDVPGGGASPRSTEPCTHGFSSRQRSKVPGSPGYLHPRSAQIPASYSAGRVSSRTRRLPGELAQTSQLSPRDRLLGKSQIVRWGEESALYKVENSAHLVSRLP